MNRLSKSKLPPGGLQSKSHNKCNAKHNDHYNNMMATDEKRRGVIRRASDFSTSTNNNEDHLLVHNMGFDELHRDYQSAIDCLVDCEGVIKSFQERLNAKDEQIANLEEKIVEMSLELASSKALEDELQHRLNRMATTGCSCGVGSDHRCGYQTAEEPDRKPIDTRKSPVSIEDEADNAPSSTVASRRRAPIRRVLSRSFCSRSQTLLLSNTNTNTTFLEAPVDKAHQKNRLDTANSNNGKTTPSPHPKLTRHNSMIELNHNERQLDRSEDSSSSSNRISMYLMRWKKTSNDHPNNPRENKPEKNPTTITKQQQQQQQHHQQQKQKRRMAGRQKTSNPQTSSESVISCVIFPVSSDDCLSTLAGNNNDGSSRRPSTTITTMHRRPSAIKIMSSGGGGGGGGVETVSDCDWLMEGFYDWPPGF